MTYRPSKEVVAWLATLDPAIRHHAILADLKLKFDAGQSVALLDALEYCLNSNTLAPAWVRTGFNAAYTVRWSIGQARTLDDAFQVARPKGWSQGRYRKDFIISLVYQKVMQHLKANPRAIDTELFAEVANEMNEECENLPPDHSMHGISHNEKDIRDAYYRVVKIIKKSSYTEPG